MSEHPRFPSARELTDQTLRFYHEIFERPVLQEWRKRVPQDARRAWIRHMVSRAIPEKLGGDLLFQDLYAITPPQSAG